MTNPRFRTFLSGLLIGGQLLLVPACAVDPVETGATTSRLEESETYRDALREVSANYRDLEIAPYRIATSAMLSEMATRGDAEIYAMLEAILEVGAESADGLEPLLLAAIDHLERAEDPSWREETRALVSERAGALRFEVAEPNRAFVVPLGRTSTRAVLDVRADAVRVIATRAIDRIVAGEPGSHDLDGVLADPRNQKDLCELPPRSGGADRGLEVQVRQPDFDETRAKNCEEDGRPGGNAAGLAGDLGPLAESACLNPTFVGALDGYGYEERISDLQACSESLRGGEKDGLGPQVSSPAIAVGIAAIVLATARWAIDKHFETVRDEIAQARDAVDAAREAVDAAQDARDAYEQAQENTRQAQKELAAAESELEQDPDNEEKQQGVKDAQAKLDEAKTKEEEAKQAKEKAEAEEKEKLDEATKKVEELEGGEDPGGSAACERAFDGMIPDATGVLEDWEQMLDEHDPTKPTDPVSNWDPTSDQGIDPMDAPGCGVDPATAAAPTAQCDGLVHCPEGDLHCACNQSMEPPPAELIASMTSMVCGFTLDCPDGRTPEALGGACVCTSGEEDPEAPTPPAPPFLPSHRFVNAMFAAEGLIAEGELAPLEAFTVQAAREMPSP